MTRALVCVLVVLCVSVTIGDACSCMARNPKAMLCWKDMIFRGKTLSEFKQGPTNYEGEPWMLDMFSDWIYTIQVDQVFWAKEEFRNLTTITVKTPVQSSLCGIRLPLDIPYLFFVNADSGGLFRTGLCDQNTPWDNVDPEYREHVSTVLPNYCTGTRGGRQP